jgi:hypothetical protein
MEPLSILNPPIEDILNDPRLSFDEVMKKIDKQHGIVTKQVMDWASNAGQVEPIDAMMFADDAAQGECVLTQLVT